MLDMMGIDLDVPLTPETISALKLFASPFKDEVIKIQNEVRTLKDKFDNVEDAVKEAIDNIAVLKSTGISIPKELAQAQKFMIILIKNNILDLGHMTTEEYDYLLNYMKLFSDALTE